MDEKPTIFSSNFVLVRSRFCSCSCTAKKERTHNTKCQKEQEEQEEEEEEEEGGRPGLHGSSDVASAHSHPPPPLLPFLPCHYAPSHFFIWEVVGWRAREWKALKSAMGPWKKEGGGGREGALASAEAEAD